MMKSRLNKCATGLSSRSGLVNIQVVDKKNGNTWVNEGHQATASIQVLAHVLIKQITSQQASGHVVKCCTGLVSYNYGEYGCKRKPQ